MNLTELCQELRNWFDRGQVKVIGEFEIQNGVVSGIELQQGQYFRIMGSVFNDGVHQYGTTDDLQNETFTGAVWAMAVPPAVIALAAEIDDWIEKYGKEIASPYTSESFGGYSYTKAASVSGKSAMLTWQDAFANKLNRWRKI